MGIMSIERQYGKIIFICDTCEESLETKTDDWNEARAKMQAEGWRSKKYGVDWVHGCERCGVE